MNDQSALNEQLTHHLIRERVARASEPHIRTAPRRQRIAQGLHRLANRIEA
jgi:hypothetical protein